MSRKKQQLPVSAQMYLRSATARRTKSKFSEAIVRRFHRWLDTKELLLSALSPEDIASFAQKSGRRSVAPNSAYLYTRQLKPYLLFLYQRGELSFDPGNLAIRRPRHLPELAQRFLQDPDTKKLESMIVRFHKWLDSTGRSLSELSTRDLQEFFSRRARANEGASPALSPEAVANNKQRLAPYLFWLWEQGHLTFKPEELRLHKRIPLPASAVAFLQKSENSRLKPVVSRFHCWLTGKKTLVSGISADEVERYLDDKLKTWASPHNRMFYKRGLVAYLYWLYERDGLSFEPQRLGIHQRTALPPSAVEFLRLLQPTRKQGTCNSYRTHLRAFHDWLTDARFQLWRIDRAQIEQWLHYMHVRNLAASTRTHAILQVRSYLRWLFERGELRNDPDFLLRRTDVPKLPAHLPRPLSPEIDSELQCRLKQSDDPLWRGLWLARQTGMRIGELIDLSYDCVCVDAGNRHFLMVPLGKLYNERLVPLTDTMVDIIRWLQNRGAKPREVLLERNRSRALLAQQLRQALKDACAGLRDGKPITPHRLRHTAATSWLSGGMSLMTVMKLLGHRDYRMTLRYTAITQEMISREYFEALHNLQDRYKDLQGVKVETDQSFDPIKALADVATWLHRAATHTQLNPRMVRLLTKRLLRIQFELRALCTPSGS